VLAALVAAPAPKLVALKNAVLAVPKNAVHVLPKSVVLAVLRNAALALPKNVVPAVLKNVALAVPAGPRSKTITRFESALKPAG
jgi:hypothetical protein